MTKRVRRSRNRPIQWSASAFFRFYRKENPRCSASTGFTLVEMLVVTGVVMLLSTILIVYNNSSRQQISLFVEEVKISQLISRAKSLAISTYGSTAVPCGYGFYVDYSNRTYCLFKYDPGAGKECWPPDQPPPATDPSLSSCETNSRPFSERASETFTLNPNLEFESGSYTDELRYVFFIPPGPKTVLDTPGNVEGKIYLKTRDNSQHGLVEVSPFWQINFRRP